MEKDESTGDLLEFFISFVRKTIKLDEIMLCAYHEKQNTGSY